MLLLFQYFFCISFNMVNKCVVSMDVKVVVCPEKRENPVSTFRFPLHKPDLLQNRQHVVNLVTIGEGHQGIL